MYVPEQVHRVADRGGGGALARAHQRRAAALRRRLGRQARSGVLCQLTLLYTFIYKHY